jgi:hypothetical protein
MARRPTPRPVDAAQPSPRELLVSTWVGRLFIVAAVLKFAIALWRLVGELPTFGRVLSGAATIGLAVALAMAFLVPQFDAFGKQAAANEIVKEQKVLKALDKATEERKTELRKKNPEAALSEDVEQSIEQLKQSLKQMQPTKKPENLKILSDRQKDLVQ